MLIAILKINTIRIGFPGGSAVKNLPDNAGDAGLIPGSGRSLKEKMATHASTLAWRIPWTGEPGGLQFMGSHRVRHDEQLTHRTGIGRKYTLREARRHVFQEYLLTP